MHGEALSDLLLPLRPVMLAGLAIKFNLAPKTFMQIYFAPAGLTSALAEANSEKKKHPTV